MSSLDALAARSSLLCRHAKNAGAPFLEGQEAFRLALAMAGSDLTHKAEVPLKPFLWGHRVAIDPRILEPLESLLESAGHAARLFTSATALLDDCSFAEIDCLISDISMPRIDGWELQRLVPCGASRAAGHPDQGSRRNRPGRGDPSRQPALPPQAVRWSGAARRPSARH